MSEAVRTLLAFLDDARPAPRIQRLASVHGPAPMRKAPCQACGGRGRDRFRRECDECHGQGWNWRDSYLERPVGHETTGLVTHSRWIKCPFCAGEGVHRNTKTCSACRGAGGDYLTLTPDARAAGPGRVDDADDVLSVALIATRTVSTLSLRRTGSFAALETALAELTPRERRLLARTDLTEAEAAEEGRIIRRLAHAIEKQDGQVRVPGQLRQRYRELREKGPTANGTGRWANGAAQSKRNQEIRRLASEEGLTGREIARRLGISEATVSRTLRKTP